MSYVVVAFLALVVGVNLGAGYGYRKRTMRCLARGHFDASWYKDN